jgi:hypothetical protein
VINAGIIDLGTIVRSWTYQCRSDGYRGPWKASYDDLRDRLSGLRITCNSPMHSRHHCRSDRVSTATTSYNWLIGFRTGSHPGLERRGNPSIATQLQILEKFHHNARLRWRGWFV